MSLYILFFQLAVRALAQNLCPGGGPSGRCVASTFSGILPPGASIEKVSTVTGGCYGEGSSDLAQPNYAYNLPQLCAVTVNISTYRFGLFLPTSSNWNGRFLVAGNYAFLGGINWVDMTPGPNYNMATLSTDTGHSSGVGDLSWSAGNQRAQLDWGYAALNGSTYYGKLLTERYYSKKISYSYYTGCSTGGRQGLKQIQVNQTSFDGVLAGAPAWQSDHLNPWYSHLGTYNLPEGDPKDIYQAQWTVMANLAQRQCDNLDGVTDGIISLDNCTVTNFASVQCGQPGVDPNNCLTAAQINTAMKVYSDYVLADGTFVYPGPIPGSEADFASSLAEGLPSGFDQEWEKYMLYNDPNWTWQNFSDQVFRDSVRLDPGHPTANQYDISQFRARGGKIVLYHGLADGVVPTKGSNIYYNATQNAMGGTLQDWFRYFQVPGMHHCASTDANVNAPWYFAGAGQPALLYPTYSTGYSVPGHVKDEKYDIFLALVDWVENGKPVDSVIATVYNGNTLTVNRTRPLCPWPQRAVWDSTKNQNNASSWSCK